MVYALGGGRLAAFGLDPGHAEVSFRTTLLPVWYESAAEPAHVWQSTSGSDDFEPKLGLVPLIFGTLKATFYSLLFSVPLALLAGHACRDPALVLVIGRRERGGPVVVPAQVGQVHGASVVCAPEMKEPLPRSGTRWADGA